MRVNFESTDRKAEESGTLREYNRQNIRKIYPTGRRNLKKKTKLNFEKFLVSKERKTEKNGNFVESKKRICVSIKKIGIDREHWRVKSVSGDAFNNFFGFTVKSIYFKEEQ